MARDESHEFELEAGDELRFEVLAKTNDRVLVTVRIGMAEYFGADLVPGWSYDFASGAVVAIYTKQGCVLEVEGKTSFMYVGKNTPMPLYCNFHTSLEFKRLNAITEHSYGPTVMVVGHADSGKTSLCRILLNYSVNNSHKPMFVDLDVMRGYIGPPGTIGASQVERKTQKDTDLFHKDPLIYHYGHSCQQTNGTLYGMLITELARTVRLQRSVSDTVKSSGIIINTSSWTRGEGYAHLLHTAKVFEVNIIIILDLERLYHELLRDVPNSVHLLSLPKSGGVVQRCFFDRLEESNRRLKEFFYGTTECQISPQTIVLNWCDIRLYKIGCDTVPESCMPYGMKTIDHLTKLIAIEPSKKIENHLISVSPEHEDEHDIITKRSESIICVLSVDCENKTMTVLKPSEGPLTNNVLLLSDLEFLDRRDLEEEMLMEI